jgi:hypothetical protein
MKSGLTQAQTQLHKFFRSHGGRCSVCAFLGCNIVKYFQADTEVSVENTTSVFKEDDVVVSCVMLPMKNDVNILKEHRAFIFRLVSTYNTVTVTASLLGVHFILSTSSSNNYQANRTLQFKIKVELFILMTQIVL